MNKMAAICRSACVKNSHIVISLAVSFACLVLVSSCAPAPVNESAELVSAQSVPLSEGELLYQQYCASCHRPLAKTLKPNRSFSRIQSAIRHYPSMQYLGNLTDAQLQAIADSLSGH